MELKLIKRRYQI